MRVTAQYAETHFADLLSAADNGEEVEIERPDKPGLRLVISQPVSSALPPKPSRAELFGSAKGKIWLADDWDSPETNKKIEYLFENSVLFPEPEAD